MQPEHKLAAQSLKFLFMSIDKDINQKKFRNDYQRVIINLIYTYNWVSEQTKSILEKGDITSQIGRAHV